MALDLPVTERLHWRAGDEARLHFLLRRKLRWQWGPAHCPTVHWTVGFRSSSLIPFHKKRRLLTQSYLSWTLGDEARLHFLLRRKLRWQWGPAHCPTVHRTVGFRSSSLIPFHKKRRPLTQSYLSWTLGDEARLHFLLRRKLRWQWGPTHCPTVHRTVGFRSSSLVPFHKKKTTAYAVVFFYGAGDEARTRYLHLGKVALYRMSYTRGTD